MKFIIEKAKADIPKTLEDFPLYTTFIINQASQTAQATRPKQVGQLSELFPEYEEEARKNNQTPSVEGWKEFHNQKVPNALQNSFTRLKQMFENFKEAIHKIDDKMIITWLEDLLYEKTFYGLSVENIIREFLRKKHKINSRKATVKEESQNIDFLIMDNEKNKEYKYQIKPISLKGTTYHLVDSSINIVWYKREGESLHIEFDDSYLEKLMSNSK